MRLLEQFKSFAISVSSRCGSNVRPIKNKNAYRIAVTGVHAARMIHALYKDSIVHLDRKKKTANEIIKNPKYSLEMMEEASLLYRPNRSKKENRPS